MSLVVISLAALGIVLIAIALMPGGSGKTVSRRVDAFKQRHQSDHSVETQLRGSMRPSTG